MEPKEKRKSSVRYAPEVCERAVHMVREHAGDHAQELCRIMGDEAVRRRVLTGFQ
jgi:hypothetical protein